MNESQQLIAEGINRLLAAEIGRPLLEAFDEGTWPEGLWKLVQQSGFHRALEDDGKAVSDWTDVQPILRAIGFYRAPLPLAETLLANWLAAKAGIAGTDGPATVVETADLQFQLVAGKLTFSGIARLVPWARVATRFVVSGVADGRRVIGIVEAGNPGLRHIEPGKNVAGEPRDTVEFEQCQCSQLFR